MSANRNYETQHGHSRRANRPSPEIRVDPSVMSRAVVDARTEVCRKMKEAPIPDQELVRNLGLYQLPMEVKRILFFAEIYQQILEVPGVIMEFGCRWGQNLATLQSLRAIFEPYHHRRRIIGFDTFAGFPHTAEKDGTAAPVQTGAYGVTPDYDQYLRALLLLRETQAPLAEVCKFDVVTGDVCEQLPAWLEKHPETIVAFAYFDLDLYRPTRDCLQMLKDHLTQGSIVGFDELNHEVFPGETVAVREVLGLRNVRLRRSPFSADECYFVV